MGNLLNNSINIFNVMLLGVITWLIKSWITELKVKFDTLTDKVIQLQLKVNTLETLQEKRE